MDGFPLWTAFPRGLWTVDGFSPVERLENFTAEHAETAEGLRLRFFAFSALSAVKKIENGQKNRECRSLSLFTFHQQAPSIRFYDA